MKSEAHHAMLAVTLAGVLIATIMDLHLPASFLAGSPTEPQSVNDAPAHENYSAAVLCRPLTLLRFDVIQFHFHRQPVVVLGMILENLERLLASQATRAVSVRSEEDEIIDLSTVIFIDAVTALPGSTY
jgi:hypothetical protein